MKIGVSIYDVSNFKFMQLDDGVFYISLDPDDSTEKLSGDDLDYIYSKKIELNSSIIFSTAVNMAYPHSYYYIYFN